MTAESTRAYRNRLMSMQRLCIETLPTSALVAPDILNHVLARAKCDTMVPIQGNSFESPANGD